MGILVKKRHLKLSSTQNQMIIIWMQVVITAVLADPEITLNSLCEQMNTTDDMEGFLWNDKIVFVSDCLDLGNKTSINSSVFGMPEDLKVNANETHEGTPATGSPAWMPTFLKVQFAIKGVYLPIVSVLGIIGNSITLSVLRKNVLQSSSTIYLKAMTVTELIYTINYFPVSFRSHDAIWNTRVMKTITAIRFSYFTPLTNLLHTASVWITIFLTIERLVVVKWPMKAKEFSTKRRAWVAVIGAYVLSLALNGIRFFRRHPVQKVDPVTQETYLIHTYTDFGRMETVSAVTFWSHFIFTDSLPFIMLVCLNASIIFFVRRAQRKRLTMADRNTCGRKNSQQNQITRLLIFIVMAYLICNVCSGMGAIWLAENGVVVLRSPPELWYYIFLFAIALQLTNPLINCILYIVCSAAFREGLKSQFCAGRKPKNKPHQTKTSRITTTTGRQEELNDPGQLGD